MVDISNASGKRPIASKDRAETFEESDVSVLFDKTGLGAGSLELGDVPTGNVTTRPDDETDESESVGTGLTVTPNKDLLGVYAEVSTKTEGAAAGYIEAPDGTVISERRIRDGSVVLPADLEQGTEYNVYVDNDGFSYLSGKTSSVSFPYSGTDLDITAGYNGGNTNQYYAYGINNLEGVEAAKSGTAFIEWPHPDDVYRWDAASFQTSEDGETVKVYVEESSDGGSTWTEIQGPISRGDQIEADPESRVRFRVEIARSDTSNTPTLDAIYRRWVV